MRSFEVIEKEARATNNAIKKAILSGDSIVQQFYNNAVVFVTGGSGFVGKNMIEKIFRSSNIKKLYILLRVKKGKSVQERLKAILKDPVFEELLKEQPDFVDKIELIEGDTSEENLGINEKNWTMLIDEVNIIFHAAASLSFRESMKWATLINIRGTREMLRLAKACKYLKSVVHVSTAYTYATKSRVKGDIKEDFYKTPVPPETMIQLAENMDEDQLNDMFKPFLEQWPNCYAITKAITEDLVRVMGEDLPIGIVRPAVVISAYREPTLGWIDEKNVYGHSGIILGISLGAVHTLLANTAMKNDFVPVDVVANTIITAAFDTYDNYIGGDRKTIIYTVSINRNPITFGESQKILNTEGRKLIPSKAIWYCSVLLTQYKLLYLVLEVILHYIPGIIADGCCVLIGQKPRLFKVYRLIHSLSSVFAFYLNYEWNFHDANTLNMYNKLSETDKVIYNCNISSVNMKELILIWFYGVGKFIIKDDMKDRTYAIRKQSLLKIIHYMFFPLYLYSLFKLTLAVISLIYFVFIMFCKLLC